MSRYIATRAIRGANALVTEAEFMLNKALTVQAHRFSKSAQEKIAAAGGTVQTLELLVTGAAATIKLLPKQKLEKLKQAKQ